MGIYDLNKVLDGYRAGNLDAVLREYSQNDLAFLAKELGEYLKLHNLFEENKGLLTAIKRKIKAEE